MGGEELNKEKKKKQEQIIQRDEMELRKNSKELSELKKLSRKNTGNKKGGKSFIKKGWFPFLIKSKKKETVQDTIPYKRMLKDGICQVEKDKYNKTIRFFDINYRLMEEEDQEGIFADFSSFLNFFDSSVEVEFNYINSIGENEERKELINIKETEDDFNEIRNEYRQMLLNQSSKGNNGLSKNMYVTFTIKAEDLKQAKSRLERIESDILTLGRWV